MKTIKEILLPNDKNDDEFSGYEVKFAIAVGLVFLIAAIVM